MYKKHKEVIVSLQERIPSKQKMKITSRAIIFNSEKKLLMVQHHGSDFWSLPGGKTEKGEDLKTCLQREIFEELGLKCKIKHLAFIHEFQWSKKSDIITEFFFVAEISEKNIENFSGKCAKTELKKIEWNILEKKLNIKPEFLKNFSAEKICEKKFPEYFSYIS